MSLIKDFLLSNGCKAGATAKAAQFFPKSELTGSWKQDQHKTAPWVMGIDGITLRCSGDVRVAIETSAEVEISIFEFENEKKEKVSYARVTAVR